MNVEENPLKPALDDIFARLNRLNDFLFLLDSQLEKLRDVLSQHGFPWKLAEIPLVGASLIFTDLVGETDNGCLYHHSSGAFHVTGGEYDEMGKALVSREAAWTVSQAYEAFESFLFDVAASFLHANESSADQTALAKYKEKKAHDSAAQTNFSFWRDFVRWKYRGNNNVEILKELRRLAPESGSNQGLENGERDNTRRLDLRRWYTALSEVRHAATHADCRLEKPSHESAVRDNDDHWFPLTVDGDRRVLTLTQRHATNCLETIVEYAFLIFKSLSTAREYTWELPQMHKPERASDPSANALANAQRD